MKNLFVSLVFILLTAPGFAQNNDAGTDASSRSEYAATSGTRLASAAAPALSQPKSSPAAVPLSWNELALERITDAVAKYERIAASQPWPLVPGGPSLHENAMDARVPLLRARLTVTGDFPESEAVATSNVYDAEMVAAVQRFQTRHGLVVDGIAGRETLAALNISPARRSVQLALNIKRLEQLAEELPTTGVIVNLPAATLQLEENSHTVWVTRTIVGSSGWPTPLLEGLISEIEVNPYWNVPTSIARREILPKIIKDPGYLDANDMRVLSGAAGTNEVPFEAVDWSRFLALGYRLRQEPGRKNALGVVKFIFPNPYSIFLHDTPGKELFAKSHRTFSHGCMRVEQPLELASRLLDGEPTETEASLRPAIETGKTQRLRLSRPVPIRTVYVTAWVADDGSLQFRPDVYGHDAAAIAKAKLSGCNSDAIPAVEAG